MKTFLISFSVCLAFVLGATFGRGFKKGKLDMISQFLFQTMKAKSDSVLTKMGLYLPQVTLGNCLAPIGSGILCFNDSLEHLERIGNLAKSIKVKSEKEKEQP